MADVIHPDTLNVIDFGVGMPPALICRFLHHYGMRVTRFEPATGDPFYEVHEAYSLWHQSKAVSSIENLSDEAVETALREADVAIIGGEDHPNLNWKLDPLDLSRRYPHLVIVDLTGYPRNGPMPQRPAVDLLVQARSGLVNEQYADRPIAYAFPASLYGSAMQAIVGLFAALIEREESGVGQVVSSSMFEGALMWCIWEWSIAECPDLAFTSNAPKSPRPTIFRCSDGVYIHIVMGSRGSKGRLYRILGIDDPGVGMEDSGMPGSDLPPDKYFGDVDQIAPYVARWSSQDLIAACTKAEIPAALVLDPGVCWDDPQVEFNGTIVQANDGTRHVGHPVRTRWLDSAGSASSGTSEAMPKKGPLAGLRVLDISAFVAGPYVALLLSDLGAEVIKVEPVGGEPNRKILPVFMSNNRGKRSLAVNLKSAEGSEIIHRLAESADIVLNNYRPNVAIRLGVDSGTLHGINPGLVTLDVTAFGLDGPKADRPGFDMIMQATAGHEIRGAPPGGEPFWTRSSMVDYTSGLLGAAGALAALFRCRRQGGGAAVDVSLLDAGIFLLSEMIRRPNGEFSGFRRANRNQTGFSPAHRLYRTEDGWIALVIFGEQDARALQEVLVLDAPFSRPPSEWDDTEEERIEAALAALSTSVATELLDGAGVWNEPVDSKGKSGFLKSDSWLKFGKVLSHVDAGYGEVRQLGPMLNFSRTRVSPNGWFRRLGADNHEILRELGYDMNRIAELEARGIILGSSGSGSVQ